jgi:hypothetical protein
MWVLLDLSPYGLGLSSQIKKYDKKKVFNQFGKTGKEFANQISGIHISFMFLLLFTLLLKPRDVNHI